MQQVPEVAIFLSASGADIALFHPSSETFLPRAPLICILAELTPICSR